MIGNRLYINGKDYTQWASGLDELTESYQVKDDGTIEIGQTSQIVLTGLAYDYWKDIFFENSCVSIDREYDVRIKVESCNQNLDFIIRSQGVSIDYVGCKIKMNLNSKNTKEDQIAILQKTYFWDEEYNFIKEYHAKGRIEKMLYVKELTYLSKIIIYLYFVVLLPLITALKYGILLVLDLIVSAINALGGNIDKPGDLFKDIEETVEMDLIGAGEFTTVYYLQDIFEFWAKEAGLTFKSTILQAAPYNSMVLFGQMIKKGPELSNCDKVVFDKDNAPNYNCIELLNLLKPVFNADWKIIGNDLIFERKDYFENVRQTLFNLDQEINSERIINGTEYTFDNSSQFARLKAEFSFDAVDTQGNRNIFEHYSNVIDWNPGLAHKNRKGSYTPDIEFGACRFTDDIAKSEINSIVLHEARGFGILEIDLDFSHSLVLTNDTAQNLKLIVLDQNYERLYKGCAFKFAVKKMIKYPSIVPYFGESIGVWDYNMPMWLNNELYPGQNLVDKFHYIENPDLKLFRFVEIKNLTWKPKNFCDAVTFLKANKLNINISSKYGDATIGSFVIDYGKCQINLSELKFKCHGVS